MDKKSWANQLIQSLGGTENIQNLIHCMTRLRFSLIDENKADSLFIEKMPDVIKIVQAQGQFQVVIGNKVSSYYHSIIEEFPKLDFSKENAIPNNTARQEIKHSSGILSKMKQLYDEFIGVLTASMIPIIGILAGSGIVKGLLSGLVSFNLVATSSSIYILLSTIVDTAFYFLPVILGFTAAKKLGSNPIVLAVVGGVIIHPTIIALSGLGDNVVLSLFGNFTFTIMNYSGSVFPIIVAAWCGKYIEQGLKKVLPEMIQSIFVPVLETIFLSLLILIIIGPIITLLSRGLADGIELLLSLNSIIGGAIYCALYPLLVIFGLHWPLIPIVINDLAVNGYSIICALTSVMSMGIAGGVLAVAIKTKDKGFKTLSYSATISQLCGISEPALYGVLLKYKRVLYMVIIANGVGGSIAGALGLVIYGFTGSLVGFPSFIDPNHGITDNFWNYAISHTITFLIAFTLVFVWGFTDKKNSRNEEESIAQGRQ